MTGVRQFRDRVVSLGGALALVVPGVLVIAAPTAVAAVEPVANPLIEDSCGVDATLVLDASGSIESSHAVENVRDAAAAFLDALNNTDSTARVTQFASVSEELAPRGVVDDASLGQNGALTEAVNGYYDPKPPRPSGTTIYQYDGSGNPLSSGNFRESNGSNQYTNWDQSLDQAGDEPSELVVYVTDGDPTAFDFNQPGDPFDAGPPPDVAVRTDGSTDARSVTLDRAVEEANAIKTADTRILAVGVGSALSSSDSRDRLAAISGPQVVRDADLADIDSLNDVDVALVTDFDDLAAFLRSVVLELCSPSLTIRKLAQSAGDASYQPAPGWDLTVTPTVPGGFEWVLPDTAAATSKTVTTNDGGFAQFQWEPTDAVDSSALVEEELQDGFVAGRPPQGDGDPSDDYRCEAKNEFGDVREVVGEFDPGVNPSFTLDPIGPEIVTCTLWNSFDYQPAIALTKVNAPPDLRGDLVPPAEVTSTYEVTNPGNTPLDTITVTDDRCGPAQPSLQGDVNVGDTNQDGRLDPGSPGETWIYTCTRSISTPASTDPAGQSIDNTATVNGSDPTGTIVTATATDDVTAFNPAIELTKLVNGEKSAVIESGTDAVYTFAVANTGNTDLATATLTDDHCGSPTRGVDSPGNNDATLDVGETWTYSCVQTIDEATINTADVVATPLAPGGQPFPSPNPDVTDTDTAQVTTVDAELSLTKTVDQSVVFPGTSATYTYQATNEGDTDLRNDTGDSGWVTDNKCDPVTQVLDGGDNAGDENGDSLMNPGETWQFTCTTEITEDTLNTATIEAQPVDPQGEAVGDALVRTATALVDIVRPGISLTKTALKPVVKDPDTIFIGPRLPDPAVYLYDVTNTGQVPLRDVTVEDDTCSPLNFIGGDTNGDDALDVGEVWRYGCFTNLQRDQGTPVGPPPITGAESGLVTNTATVTGTPFLPDNPQVTAPDVSDSDTARVLVVQPGIAIEKTVDPEVVTPGSDVTYTFVVSNTGDASLRLVGPTDDKCHALEYQSGDVNDNELLDGANAGTAESWTYTCSRMIGLPAAPETADVNRVGVRGVGPLGTVVGDRDEAQVTVLDPAIHLEKSVSDDLVPTGTEVTYDFLVTNVGGSPVAADDVLAQVTLTDTSDPALPTCDSPTLVAKEGGNQDDLLDREPAETWRYQCASTITEPTTNEAVVRAVGGTQFDLSIPVLDVDAAFVQPFTPGIEVTKAADPTQLLGPGEVTYTYAVHNTGDVPLGQVAERITDDTCAPVTYVSGDEDLDGLLDSPTSIFEDSRDETWLFTCTTTVTETTTNVVEVPGTPTDPDGEPLCGPEQNAPAQVARVAEPCDVTGNDRETVVVVDPGTITVVKKSEPATDQTFDFTVDDTDFQLANGASKVLTDLAPGTYSVSEQSSSGWVVTGLVCDDPTGDSTVSVTAGTATVDLAEGESVTCTFTNGAEPSLPDTGARGIGSLLALSAGLLVMGGALLWYANRHRAVI